jgi:hypothetical protein
MDTDSRLDQIDSKLGNISVTLASQHVSLKEHMKRANELELQMDVLKQSYDEFRGALKFVQAVVTALGAFAACVEILRLFKH